MSLFRVNLLSGDSIAIISDWSVIRISTVFSASGGHGRMFVSAICSSTIVGLSSGIEANMLILPWVL